MRTKQKSVCKHCKRPVRETAMGLGYCKACIDLARPVSRAKADRGNDAQFRKYAGLKGPGKVRAR